MSRGRAISTGFRGVGLMRETWTVVALAVLIMPRAGRCEERTITVNVTADGQPVQGADVRIHGVVGGTGGCTPDPLMPRTYAQATDAKGAFSFTLDCEGACEEGQCSFIIGAETETLEKQKLVLPLLSCCPNQPTKQTIDLPLDPKPQGTPVAVEQKAAQAGTLVMQETFWGLPTHTLFDGEVAGDEILQVTRALASPSIFSLWRDIRARFTPAGRRGSVGECTLQTAYIVGGPGAYDMTPIAAAVLQGGVVPPLRFPCLFHDSATLYVAVDLNAWIAGGGTYAWLGTYSLDAMGRHPGLPGYQVSQTPFEWTSASGWTTGAPFSGTVRVAQEFSLAPAGASIPAASDGGLLAVATLLAIAGVWIWKRSPRCRVSMEIKRKDAEGRRRDKE